ncbi:hypothetical protein ACFL6M_01870 [Candidatus Eisenbacteria bacterium]|uniref:Uncharacterized protein n=1 Tax=Eiseniibacteriota bacterium TaxID=2212470 RepID=A0ABV6YJ31_UNCEI
MRCAFRNLDTKGWAAIALAVLLVAIPRPILAQAKEISADALNLEEALGLYGSDASSDGKRLRDASERAQSLGIQEDLLTRLLHESFEYGGDGAQTVAILEHTLRVLEQNLPVQLIVDRYLQGMAKGVAFDRIRSVTNALETRLLDAAVEIDVVYMGIDEPESRQDRSTLIDHTAYAFGAGVSKETLRRTLQLVSDSGQGIDAAGAVVVSVGLLVSSGMDPDRSFEVVETGWTHGYRGGDLEHLCHDLGALSSQEKDTSGEVVDQFLNRIRGREDRDRILHDLDAMHGRLGDGHHLPGSRPGDDPTKMHGPGGPPDNPGHQDDRGHHGGGKGR